MGARRKRGNRQAELFPRSIKPVIVIEKNHRLVQLTEELDWTELEQIVQEIRRSKLKNDAGRPPHLRALIGAVVFRATRRMSYRDTEDQIRHYAPARYLCGLTETEWTPDANTIQDFEELLGEDGMARLNEHTVKEAVRQGLADETLMVADTTAQEAAIPYPNEMNLTREMSNLVERAQSGLRAALQAAEPHKNRLIGYGKVAHAKTRQLHETMTTLLPQIRYWIRTGFVASNKIVSLHMRELYSVVRGKVGKAVEFGLQWGISRLGGGFLLATVGMNRRELVDSKFAVKAVDDHIALFGKAPQT